MGVVNVDKDWIQQLYLKEQMELNDVKKALYKEKPKAKLVGKKGTEMNDNSIHVYKTKLSNGKKVIFNIPVEEAFGFEKEMEAQLLIRWIK